jgi:hypothetical protein
MPCGGLIPPPRSPPKCPNRFVSSEVKLLDRNRPLAYTLKEEDDDDDDDDDDDIVLAVMKIGEDTNEVKVKLSLCLTKYHAIKTYPLLN